MRRLLFNPLAQQPYASGKLDKVNNRFVIDNPLEENHVYYCKIFSGTDTSLMPCIIDITMKTDTYYTTPFALLNANGDLKYFHGDCYIQEPKYINIDTTNDTISTDDNYDIYIYKLM